MRTIMIFPEFDNIDKIEEIRGKYDPLHGLVRPHITLVFPFEDTLSNEELERKMATCLADTSPFRLVLQGMSKQKSEYGNYLFLNVAEGAEKIIRIHDALYRGIWGKEMGDYVPHMTVGRLPSEEEMDLAFIRTEKTDTRFETIVRTISVEMIGEQEESIIIIEKELKDNE